MENTAANKKDHKKIESAKPGLLCSTKWFQGKLVRNLVWQKLRLRSMIEKEAANGNKNFFRSLPWNIGQNSTGSAQSTNSKKHKHLAIAKPFDTK